MKSFLSNSVDMVKNLFCYPWTTDAQWSLFSSKSQTYGLGQTIWTNTFWGIWGIFGRFISTNFVLWLPCPWFPLNNHYYYKKLSLYIQIFCPNLARLEKNFQLVMEKQHQKLADANWNCWFARLVFLNVNKIMQIVWK